MDNDPIPNGLWTAELGFNTLPGNQPFGSGSILIDSEAGLVSNVVRMVHGAVPVLAYGFAGTVEQFFVAPAFGQIPLVGGFTLDTPWSIPAHDYDIGVSGMSQALQWEHHVSGQHFLYWLPVRSHTTGLIDAGVREFTGPLRSFSIFAAEALHPGRTRVMELELTSSGGVSSPKAAQGRIRVPGPTVFYNGFINSRVTLNRRRKNYVQT